MILLDTNVVSAMLNDPPDPAIERWLNRQPDGVVWMTAVSVFEVRFGLARMEDGRKRRALAAAFEATLRRDYAGRIAPFDSAAASAAALLRAKREAAGQPREFRDTFIAGIVLSRNATLATRNVRHFADLGRQVVNP